MNKNENGDIIIRGSEESIHALLDMGHSDAPESITVRHTEASVKERRKLKELQEQNSGSEDVRWFADLLHRRVVEPVPIEVTREFVEDLPVTEIACHITAYISGEWPDSKKIAKITKKITSGMMEDVLGAMSKGYTPSLATSTGSAAQK